MGFPILVRRHFYIESGPSLPAHPVQINVQWWWDDGTVLNISMRVYVCVYGRMCCDLIYFGDFFSYSVNQCFLKHITGVVDLMGSTFLESMYTIIVIMVNIYWWNCVHCCVIWLITCTYYAHPPVCLQIRFRELHTYPSNKIYFNQRKRLHH